MLTPAELTALGSIIMIDIVLSGDNAIVIGLAVRSLPPKLRHRAIAIGIVVATACRVGFASITFYLLKIIGLTLAGGLLLLWVAFKMWRELRAGQQAELAENAEAGEPAADAGANPVPAATTFRQALTAIVVADVTMSLDNVLAVAGAARENVYILGFGLLLSILLMAVASNYIARLMDRHHWIAYVGLAIIAYVAVDMIWRGSMEVINHAGMA